MQAPTHYKVLLRERQQISADAVLAGHQVLGVESSATDEEIKKAFKKLALKVNALRAPSVSRRAHTADPSPSPVKGSPGQELRQSQGRPKHFGPSN